MSLQRFDNAELACEFAKRKFAKTGTPRCVHAAIGQNGAKWGKVLVRWYSSSDQAKIRDHARNASAWVPYTCTKQALG